MVNLRANVRLLLALFLLATSCTSGIHDQQAEKPPNVLLIFTDQQHVNMMSAAGNPYLQTPNMDRLAARGVLFRQSYCTSPVCGPARSSIITGRMPHETGVEWNGDSIRQGIKNAGEIFRAAGYETIWGGKWHLPESYPLSEGSRQKTIRGFDLLPFASNGERWMLGSETDPPLTEAVVDYLSQDDREKPFFLAVSYHNPHDICFYARKDGWVSEEDSLLEIRYYDFEYKLPDIVATHPGKLEDLPPLPVNHPVDDNEPAFLSDKRKKHKEYGLETHLANEEFGDLEWQGYLNAYHKLTEMVDYEIGQVLDALEGSGLDDNTIIIFTSDHGDGAAAHKWSAKLSLYQESATVPLIISWPGKIPQGRIDEDHLVSQIDILPTLCEYAGIDQDHEFTGKSLDPILSDPESSWRDYLVVELADFKPDQSRKGRMVRTDQFKYNVFSSGDRNEQLFDLKNDPGETRNLAYDPDYLPFLKQHRILLRRWMSDTEDNFLVDFPAMD
ncbi:MAG: sulfatase-like hydrolase/transferase [Saprospiraceae bacterium]|nr:sulfatase-like hydrolase/transferase [Saprospiraceae bacterium]